MFKMKPTRLLHVIFLIAATTGKSHGYDNGVFDADHLLAHLERTARLFLQNCRLLPTVEERPNIMPLLKACLKQKALKILDTTFKSDCIEIIPGIDFVKIRNSTGNFNRKMDDDMEKFDWEIQMIRTVSEALQTYTLEIHLEHLLKRDTDVNEARYRRHRKGNMIMPFLMFGVVAMGMLLIPMGFKFLTVLGAKALLLSKMALILTSIQGLKKMATSGINYGLYHSPNPLHYDRHGVDDVPDEQLDSLSYNFLRT